MFKLLRIIISVKYLVIKRIRKRMFERNALVGANTVFGIKSRCTNQVLCKESIVIGSNCNISGTIIIQGNGRVHIGDSSFVGDDTVIGSVDRIDIGENSIISNHVHIYDNNNHPTAPAMRIKMCESGIGSKLWDWEYADYKSVKIEENVWICEYSYILKGVTIGKGAIVAAFSVVTKDVPPYTIVAGNPARVVKQL